MKRVKIVLAASLIAGLSFSVLAWQNRKLMTPAQETAIFSLANRYLDAGCRRPSDIAEIFEGSVIPSSLLNKSKAFLSERLLVEGECFGLPIAELQEDILRDIGRMPRELIKMQMTSEIAVNEFLDCLVEVERSFYSLQIATRKIFTCIDRHLDVRGFWHEMLQELKPAESAVPSSDPYLPPVPSGYSSPYDNCINDCNERYLMDSSGELFRCQDRCLAQYNDDTSAAPAIPVGPSPFPVIPKPPLLTPVYDIKPMPELPSADIES